MLTELTDLDSLLLLLIDQLLRCHCWPATVDCPATDKVIAGKCGYAGIRPAPVDNDLPWSGVLHVDLLCRDLHQLEKPGCVPERQWQSKTPTELHDRTKTRPNFLILDRTLGLLSDTQWASSTTTRSNLNVPCNPVNERTKSLLNEDSGMTKATDSVQLSRRLLQIVE